MEKNVERFVLIDECTEAVLGSYDNKVDAIEESKELQKHSLLGCYLVCKCENNVYDISSPIFKSSEMSAKI